MQKKRLSFKLWWRKKCRFFGNILYLIYRYFHTNAKVRVVLIATIFVGLLLATVVFVPGLKDLWPAFFGALTNSLLGIFIGSLYVLIRVIFEDQHKVTQECKVLYKYYGHSYDLSFRMKNEGDLFTFVYDAYQDTNITAIEFKTYDEPYELPDFINNNFFDIFSAHRGSYKENSQTVRLHHYDLIDGKLTMHIQKSTFYNHLVTNRAIDLPIQKSLTLRELLEPGSKLNSLDKSQLSNHIGVIGLVVTKDDKIVLFHRSNTATSSKNKLTSTIAIGLKVPEAHIQNYNQKDIITPHQFDQKVKEVLHLNTCIEESDIDRIEYVGIGRDVYEGGKPHLFLTIHIHLTEKQLINRYLITNKDREKAHQKCVSNYYEKQHEYKELLRTYQKMKSPTQEHILKLNQFVDTTLKEAELSYDRMMSEDRKKQLDKNNGFYIVTPEEIGFHQGALTIEGLNQEGLRIEMTLIPEASLLMNLYFYHKKKNSK